MESVHISETVCNDDNLFTQIFVEVCDDTLKSVLEGVVLISKPEIVWESLDCNTDFVTSVEEGSLHILEVR